MKIKHLTISLLILVAVANNEAQNLIPLNWELNFKQGSITKESIPINLLLSWERQGISYLNPKGELSTSFYVPKMDTPANYILAVNLLLDIHDIYINGVYVGGDIPNPFNWTPTPNYEAKKFTIPKEHLNFDAENTITINCSNYSYTGGKGYNQVWLYAGSEPSKTKVEILFEPKDHLFNNPREVSFKLNTQANENGTLNLLVRNDYSDTLIIKQFNQRKGTQSLQVDLKDEKLPPGFYEIIASLKDEGYAGTVGWFAVSPTKIEKSSHKPIGFNEFWEGTLTELNSVEPQYKVNKVDSLCTAKRNGYVVEMQSVGNVTVRGYYFVPKQKTKHAAILTLPGYGYGFEYLDEFLKVEENVIQLAMCVRGHGISKDAFEPAYPAPGFFGYNICDKDSTVYRQIYMDCIRAVEFLLSRTEVDKSKIGVQGGSQGGGLALMTAGLASEHISACAYFDPFPTDLKNHIKIRTLINGEVNSFLEYYHNACGFEDAINTLDYLDTKYFAEKIKSPTFYATGLFDDDCPSRLGFSAYNEIQSPKQFKIYPYDSHLGESDYQKDMMAFFKEQFGF